MGGLSHITNSKRTEKKIEKTSKASPREVHISTNNLPPKRLSQVIYMGTNTLDTNASQRIQRKEVWKRRIQNQGTSMACNCRVHSFGACALITWTKPTRNPSLQPAL